MDGVPGELGGMGLVLDEPARERLAEGRRLLDVIVSEHGSLRQAAFEEGLGLGSDRPALRAYEQRDPAEHFSGLRVEQLRCLLFASAERSVTFTDGTWRRPVLIRYNEQLVRGLVWAAGVLDPGWLPGVLEAIAVRCLELGPCHGYPPTPVPGKKIPYACIRALGRSGSEASRRALARIGHATTDRRILQGLGKALAEASTRGMPAATMPAS